MTANETMDLQYFGYLSGPSRNLGERERVMDGREKAEGRRKERRSTTDLRKRIRFVECQLEEGSLSHDLNTGGITVNQWPTVVPLPPLCLPAAPFFSPFCRIQKVNNETILLIVYEP